MNPFDFSRYFLHPEAPLEAAENVRQLRLGISQLAKQVEKDAGRIADNLKGVRTSALELAEKLPRLNFANEADRKALTALMTVLEGLEKQEVALKKQETDRARAQKELAATASFYTKELKEQRKALADAYQAGDVAGLQKAARTIQALSQDAQQLNKAVRGTTSVFTAAAGSYNQASLRLQELRAELRALQGGLSATGQGFDQNNPRVAALNAEITELDGRLKNADRALGQGHRSIGLYADALLEAVDRLQQEKTSLTEASASLRAYAKSADLSADQQDKLTKEIQATDEALARNKQQLAGYGVGVTSFSDKAQAGIGSLAQSFAGAYYGIQGVATAAQQVFTNLVEYSDQASDVKKNVGLTTAEFEDLADALKALPSRTPLDGLLDEAIIGGKLGKSKTEILGFVRSIDVAVQALEDDFDGGAEQIADTLGKIEAGFRTSLGPDQEKNLINIGSAINELAASGIASSPYLAEVAERVTATAKSANLGLSPVLAYAAVLETAGFAAEVSGTSLNRLFNTLSTKRQESFNIARLADSTLTLEEFTRLINTDFEAAINLFLTGLRKGGTTTTKFNDLLATLKLQSGDAKNVITLLAKSQGELAEQQRIANEQLAAGTSLAKEAAERNDNLAGSTEKLKKSVVGAFTDGALADAVKAFVDQTRERVDLLVAGLRKVGSGIDFIRGKLGLAAPVQRDFAGEIGNTTKELYAQATAGEKLVAEYTRLAGQQRRTTQENARLQEITAELQTAFGSNVAAVQKETGALKLSTTAVQQAIEARRKLAGQQVKDLEGMVKGTKSAIESTQRFIGGATEAVGKARIKLDATGLGADARKELEEAIIQQDKLRATLGRGTVGRGAMAFPRAQREASEALFYAEKNLGAQQEKLKKQQLELANAQAALDAARKAGVVAVADQKKAGQDAGEVLDDEKKKVADLAREQYELKKARLEARAADYERQGANVANSEDIRTQAIRKAGEVRIQLAELNRDELIRQAAAANKDLIGGDQATAAARTRLSEAFKRERLDINRGADKELLALHNAFLAKAEAIDKQVTESQIAALDAIASNENLSARERQTALLAAAQKRLEIVEMEGAAMIRAAAGDAKELERIQKELEARRKAILATATRPTDFQLTDVNKQNLDNLIALERERTSRRAEGSRAEREYQDELFNLEQDRLQKRLDILKKDPERVQEAKDAELEIERRANERSIQLEKEKAERRQQIAQASFEALDTFSDVYFSRQQERLQRQQDYIRHDYDLQLAAAGDNEQLKAQVEEEYRKKDLANRRQQAKLEKQQALFSVALRTAEAVAAVLSSGGGTLYLDGGITAGILSALVIAQGAAQASLIASRQLPEFFRGTTSAPEGPAWVAERGPELIEGRDGGLRYVAQKTVTYLQEGDRVYTAEQTAARLTEDVLRADDFRRGPLAVLHSFEAATRAISSGPAAGRPAGEPQLEKALERLGDQLLRGLERNAAQTAQQLLKPRFSTGGRSLDERIDERRRQLGR